MVLIVSVLALQLSQQTIFHENELENIKTLKKHNEGYVKVTVRVFKHSMFFAHHLIWLTRMSHNRP